MAVALRLLMSMLTPLKVMLMLVELEKGWSLPPLASPLSSFLFMFVFRLEVEVGVVAYNSIS